MHTAFKLRQTKGVFNRNRVTLTDKGFHAGPIKRS